MILLSGDNAPTLYDLVNYYGFSQADVFGGYPIWNEEKRGWLQDRIYAHFQFREINQDTPAQFLHFFNRKLNEIMPTLNPIFAALENAKPELAQWQESRVLASTTPQTQLSGAEQYADALQDSRVEGGVAIATALQTWYTGVNNALLLLYTELEPLFYQFWEVN